ncbi:DUF4136 domain-containing protein [Fibrella aquatilis]|uniref:DUF4136 domain-containing protein n=1 Tax=Fibrella aquatilis TaxID=2817059 RepID=A0A939K2L7_9BACT|nr:DUF4136 domain-containing protein [Fibrella aquatilis]MBO0934211.1 DUF4136 domain-containing protein [Fibrella aquatilis]
MRRYTLGTLIIGLLVALSSCSTFRNTVETSGLPYDKRQRYERFAFIRQTDSLHNEIDVPFRRSVEQVVTAQLAYRGYKHDPSHPDFMVVFHRFDKTTDIDLVDLEATWRLINAGMQENELTVRNGVIRPHRLAKGSVLLQVYDVEQNKLIWQGYTNRSKRVAHAVDEPDKQARYLVQMVIDNFPFHAVPPTRNMAHAR